ncbi:MAG TPA: flavin reductase family protein [Mycobacteriales bacterium]
MRGIDPQELGRRIYPVLTSLVVPRPIAWVSTLSAAGVANIAPHSFFTVAGVDPPVLSFTSVGTKDSLENVRATGEFVVHVVNRAMAHACNATSTNFPPELDEFEQVGLATVASHSVAPPRLRDAPAAFECRSVGERTFGSSTVVFGEVVWAQVREDVLAEDGLADLHALDPVARAGREEWSALGDVFSLRRIPYDEWKAHEL